MNVLALSDTMTKEAAREALGFASSAPFIFIYGGSQGSARINNCILENLPELVKETQILHQTGMANFSEVEKLSQAALLGASIENRYEAVPYLTDKLRAVFDGIRPQRCVQRQYFIGARGLVSHAFFNGVII